MPKKLILIRHGKSNTTDFTDDELRTLTAKGIDEVKESAKQLQNYVKEIDCVYYSGSTRTKETLHLFKMEKNLVFLNEEIRSCVNMPQQEGLLSFIRSIPSDQNTVAIIGHNPSLHEMIQEIAQRELNEFTTGSHIVLEYEIDHWADIHFKHCINQFVYLSN